MIFLRAFPFSFSILWRYIIALPILILAMIAFGIIAVMLTLFFMLLSPFLGMLFIVAFGFGVSVVPLMVGMRVGLEGRRVKARSGYLVMVAPAIGYGFFEAMCILVLLMLAAGAYVLATPIGIDDLMALETLNTEALLIKFASVSPYLSLVLAVVFVIATFALRAGLLVPFAGASIGADPDGRKHTPFYGFGTGFRSVFALVLVSQIGLAMVFPLTLFLFEFTGYGADALARLAALEDVNSPAALLGLGPEVGMFLGVMFLLSLAFFSLQCAGAVLVFIGMREQVGARQKAWDEAMREEEENREAPMPDTDLLELLRSRMPDKKY